MLSFLRFTFVAIFFWVFVPVSAFAGAHEIAFLEGATQHAFLGASDRIAVLDAKGISILMLPTLAVERLVPNTPERTFSDFVVSADGSTIAAQSKNLGVHNLYLTLIAISSGAVAEFPFASCHGPKLNASATRLAAICIGNSGAGSTGVSADIAVWDLQSRKQIAYMPQASWTAGDAKSGNNDPLYAAHFMFTHDDSKLVVQYDAQDAMSGPHDEMIRTRYTIIDIAKSTIIDRLYHDWRYYLGDRPSASRGEVPFAISANDEKLFVGGQLSALFDLTYGTKLTEVRERVEGMSFIGGSKIGLVTYAEPVGECMESSDFTMTFFTLNSPDQRQQLCVSRKVETEHNLPVQISANGKWVAARYRSGKTGTSAVAVWSLN